MKKNKISIILRTLCLIMSAVIMLCGCDNSNTEKHKDTVTSKDIEGVSVGDISGDGFTIGGEYTASDVEPSEYPVIINGVTVSRSPEKVICLSSGLTEMIYELGFGGRLIGRGSYCSHPDEALTLNDYGRPSAPDIDTIISASPDIVITATSIPNKDITDLNENGITVLYIPAPRSTDEFGRVYSALGMVFKGLFDGEQYGSGIYSGIIKSLTESSISLGCFVYVTEELAVAGGDTFESSVLSLFGTNIADDSEGYSFARSALLEKQPDTVILNSDISVDKLKNDEIFGSLDAVKNGKIITVSNSYFESPSGRITGILNELSGSSEE